MKFALICLLALMICCDANAASRSETNLWNELRNLAGGDAVSPLAWGVVETNCQTFIKKYPESEFAPDVLGIEAQALFKQKKYDGVISRFSTVTTNALKVADKFAYWTARSYFEKQNYPAAAENFARIDRDYPASALRLEAIYRECESYAKSGDWQRVVLKLREANGAFAQTAKTRVNDQWIVSGSLLLGQAQLAVNDPEGARATLSKIPAQARPELEWQRQFLLCRAKLDTGSLKEALAATTNLLAADMGNTEWRARSIFLKGEIYERLDQLAEATRTYEAMIASDMPAARRQDAVVRVVELLLRQNDPEAAAQKLSDYLAKYPAERGSDFEWLMLGELNLKRGYRASLAASAAGQGTNFLQLAEENLMKVTKDFTNSPYLGKAELDLGWCYATQGKVADSLGAFSNAVVHLPFSEDQAVARFKLADTLFSLNEVKAAMTNYADVIERYGSAGTVKNDLFEPALYQLVRCCLQQTNSTALTAATNAVGKILAWFPEGMLADRSLLLYGQSQSPAEARAVFSDLVKRYPDSSLLPEVKLAIARTYEKETNWTAALNQYDRWIGEYSNNVAMPRAEFGRAWATYQAGNETNAVQLFTNFITRFSTNGVAQTYDLPARAQFWMGDYFWRQTDFQTAELNYEKVFLNWTNSSLAYRAKWMAGCAALQRQSPEKATNYFSSLIPDTNCPAGLRAQAAFAFGDAAMQLPSTNEAMKFNTAIDVFYHIATDSAYSNSPIAARAWGRLGDCYYLMNGDASVQGLTNVAARTVALQRYDNAVKYFQNAMESENGDVATRSFAEIRLGQTLAAMAMLNPNGAERETLLVDALGYFWSVLYEENLREGEQPDVFCLKEAGLEAGKIAGETGDWKQAKQIYLKLEKIFPPLQAALEKKIAYADAQDAEKK